MDPFYVKMIMKRYAMQQPPHQLYAFKDSALIYHTEVDGELRQMQWRFDGTRLFVPGDVAIIDEREARRLFREHCIREGKDPTSPSTPVYHLDMSGRATTRVTTFGQEEFVLWVVELGKLRRSSGMITTDMHRRIWCQAAEAFKEKWGNRCPSDVTVALDTFPERFCA